MSLIGSRAAFEEVPAKYPGTCRECGGDWDPGDKILISKNKKGEIVKKVCSDACRETFDDTFWQGVADKREEGNA